MAEYLPNNLNNLKPLCQKKVGTSVLWGSITTLLIISQAWLLAVTISAIGFDKAPLDSAIPYMGAFIIVSLFRVLTSYIGQRAGFRAGETVKTNLQKTLYQEIFSRSPLFVTNSGSGALATLLIEAPEKIRHHFQTYVPATNLAAISPLLIWIPVLYYDWLSAVIMLITAPLIPLFMILIGIQTGKKSKDLWTTLTRIGNQFLDTIQGLPTLKIFDTTGAQKETLRKSTDEYRIKTMAVLRTAFLSSVTLEFFATVSIAILAVIIGFRLMWGDIDFMSGFFVLLLAPEFYLPLRKMGAAHHAKMEATSALDKINEIFNNEKANWSLQQTGTDIPPENIKTITFKNVACTYPGKKEEALKDINFTANTGDHLILTGQSGAGKSTIFSLLLGFISPTSGEITINDQNLGNIDRERWHKQISWVPQNPTLFHGTILENLKTGLPNDITISQIREMCQNLCIDNEIMKLPQQYETPVGDKGSGLSGGQIQRIALARAILRNSKVILLDEPTASLDPDTDRKITAHLQKLGTEGKIIISITHRKQSNETRNILHIKDGRIAA